MKKNQILNIDDEKLVTIEAEEKIGVKVSILDSFMEMSGQFTVLRNTLTKSAMILDQRYLGDAELGIMIDSLEEMQKVSSTLQENISEMRKVSLEVVYKPLVDLVREFSHLLGKEVNFQLEGGELKIDSSIAKALSNSLIHMIKNSIEHGIEGPEKRIADGKKRSGIIQLKSFQDGQNIIVELLDDGNGLNKARIKEKALAKSLYTEEELETISDQNLFLLIFESEYEKTQEIADSPDGDIGMPFVKNIINQVGGKILIDSEVGQGTIFTFILPIPKSVLIIKCLMIMLNNSSFSIPLDEVAEVVSILDFRKNKMIHFIEDKIILKHQNELLPLVELGIVLYGSMGKDYPDDLNIVIIKGDGFKYGIIVDTILETEEIVVQKTSRHFKNVNSFTGVSFIGNGALALMLNLSFIASKSNIKFHREEPNRRLKKINGNETGLSVNTENSLNDDTEFMQFGLRNSKNYALSLNVINRLEDFEIKEIEYSGAIPLIRYRNDVLPLLFIERQLGLCPIDKILSDFYPHILKVIVVNKSNKIFGLVVEDIIDIGHTESSIDSANIDREGFLGTIFIGDTTITVLDVSFLVDNFVKFEENILNLNDLSLDSLSDSDSDSNEDSDEDKNSENELKFHWKNDEAA